MVTNHRKKSSRGRGSWTHGHGEKKKHRGAGSRGGRGNAGSGKRGDAKKPSYWKIKKFVGKHGFTNPAANVVYTMSISQINTNIQTLVVSGNAKKAGDVYAVNLTALGVGKLLGTGVPAYKYELTVAAATKGAIDKVVAAGGKVDIVVKELNPIKQKADAPIVPVKSEAKAPVKEKAPAKAAEKAE